MTFGVHRALAVLLLLTAPAFAEKKKISPPPEGTPATGAKLPFSPGIMVDGTLYISGMMGSKAGAFPGDFEGELKQAFENIGAVLKAAGMNFDNVVAVTVYLSDMDLFPRMNAVYSTYFHEPLPTRSTVGVNRLASPLGHVEITVIAHK